MKFKLPSLAEALCVAAILAVIAFSMPQMTAQTYNVKNILGPENLQDVFDRLATDIGAFVSSSGTSTVSGTLTTATNGYIIVATGTASNPVAGALAVSGTNFFIGTGTSWLVK